jgi:hypothetical protein
MSELFERHQRLLKDALHAVEWRGFWSPFPEVPSGKFYGETAREEGQAAFDLALHRPFELPGHPESHRVGAEASPWGPPMRPL